jgi:hypothetical protein
MAKRKRLVNTRKQNIIADLIVEYDIETAEELISYCISKLTALILSV